MMIFLDTLPCLWHRCCSGGEKNGAGGGSYHYPRRVCVITCRGAPCLSDSYLSLSICCAKRRATSFTRVWEGDKPVHHFPRFRPHIFLRAGRCSGCRWSSGVPAMNRGSVERSCIWMKAYFQSKRCSRKVTPWWITCNIDSIE